MLTLYPEIRPYNHFFLPVDNGHNIYVEEVGNPKGIPVVVLHGGPGSGISSKSRRLFDPLAYRIILFDQRGCGQSTPALSLIHNTTDDLINDIESLRIKLNIESWVVYGGSWGSTLALLYTQQHAQHVKFLILRGIFLARKKDVDWLYGDSGAARVYAEHYVDFIADCKDIGFEEIIEFYQKKFLSENELEAVKFAKRWSAWETKCSTLQSSVENEKFLSSPHEVLSFAIMEAHYFSNNCFIEENQIISNMHKLRNIRGIIIHGRQDMVCPLDNAYDLSRAWPNLAAELHIISPAGHGIVEPLLASAIVNATNFVKTICYPDK